MRQIVSTRLRDADDFIPVVAQLRCVRSASTASITALAVAPDASSIVVGDSDGLLVSWSAARPSSLQM